MSGCHGLRPYALGDGAVVVAARGVPERLGRLAVRPPGAGILGRTGRRARLGGLALLCLVLFALGACSSTPTASGGARKGGGYFQNDGPGRNEPVDLDAIPDAQPRREPLAARANRPYVVFGRNYVPATSLQPYREQGVASWYGRQFHGRRTSIGEVYDMYGMTAAHPTLPLPSYVRVTHVGNGRSVIVRVNDRGPFLNNRLIDLSWTAAAKLGYVRDGHTRVVVEQITRFDGDDGLPVRPLPELARAGTTATAPSATSPGRGTDPGTNASAPSTAAMAPAAVDGPGAAASRAVEALIAAAPEDGPDDEARLAAEGGQPAATTTVAPGVYVQLAAFANRDSAELGRRRIQAEAAWIGEFMAIHEADGLYKLQAGPFSQRADAQQALDRLRQTTALRPFMTEY